ncbi:hypothetical protein FQN54_007103 [Arachnomyces sp. PD_36]|nr:hypothetical protein FQN54_007103 [Arachnomyces sp. PD_36]
MVSAERTPVDTSTETVEQEGAQFDLIGVVNKIQTITPTLRSFFGLNSYEKLPKTSSKRQHDSFLEKPLRTTDLQNGDLTEKAESTTSTGTVLYLAYGSNMCAKTFRGKRGIDPISQVNVLVPELSLTFDIPGLPYLEPCFAGTTYRDATAASSADESTGDSEGSKWKKPLVGVVYEVTTSDFAHIIATEGGGRSYVDTLVDCHPFHPDYSPSDPVPNHPTTTPLKAHTLLSPFAAAAAAKDGAIQLPSDGTAPLPKTPSEESKWSSIFQSGHPRPTPGHSQPSPRYLNLLTSGAKEQDLPSSYREFLNSLQPYRITSKRQRVGQFIFLLLWAPALIIGIQISGLFADKDGRSPQWASAYGNVMFGGMWLTYDYLFRPVFGEGERTEGG